MNGRQIFNFLVYEKGHQNTKLAYEKDLGQFFAFIQTQYHLKSEQDVIHVHLRAWVVSLIESQLNPVSVNRKIACLKSYFKFLRSRGFIVSNPASRIRPLKTEKKLPSFLRLSETTLLLDHIEYENSFSGKRDKLVIELLYASGIRLSELINLKKDDVNFYDGTLKVIGKAKRGWFLLMSFYKDNSLIFKNISLKKNKSLFICKRKNKCIQCLFIAWLRNI